VANNQNSYILLKVSAYICQQSLKVLCSCHYWTDFVHFVELRLVGVKSEGYYWSVKFSTFIQVIINAGKVLYFESHAVLR